MRQPRNTLNGNQAVVQREASRLCPVCDTPLEPYAEADIGVGVQQFGPWGCPRCHWCEPEESSPLEPATDPAF